MTTRRQRASGPQAAKALTGPLVAVALAAVLQSPPAAAAQTSESACVQRAEGIKTAVIRMFGGDNVNYGFFRRADRASELCRSGEIDRALDMVAALRSDMRALRNELFEDR